MAHVNVATIMLGQSAQAAWMAILEVSARPSVTTSRPATRGEDVQALANARAMRA